MFDSSCTPALPVDFMSPHIKNFFYERWEEYCKHIYLCNGACRDSTCSQTHRRNAVCDICVFQVVCITREGSGRVSKLANAWDISTCHSTLFSHTHTGISLLCLTAVCASYSCVCRLSGSDRFIVAGQQCLVLSLKKPVFSPEGFN